MDMPRYKLGDRFIRKNTFDSNVLKITGIEYVSSLNIQYQLQYILNGTIIHIDEETLTELYNIKTN